MSPALTAQLAGEGKALGRITEFTGYYDHFDGAVLDTHWFSPGTADPTILAAKEGGVASFDSAAAAGTTSSIAGSLQYLVSRQHTRMIVEAKILFTTALTDHAFFVGFSDDNTTEEFPIIITAGGGYGAAEATNAAGILFDDVGTTKTFYGVAQNAGVDVDVPRDLGVTPVFGRYYILRCEIDTLGRAYYSVKEEGTDGTTGDKGQHALAVATTTLMCPWYGNEARATNPPAQVDYVYHIGHVLVDAA